SVFRCFFFQAEDGIRDFHVTGVQTCALPICSWLDNARNAALESGLGAEAASLAAGRATLENLALFPLALVILFSLLFFFMKKQGHQPHVSEDRAMEKAAEHPQL